MNVRFVYVPALAGAMGLSIASHAAVQPCPVTVALSMYLPRQGSVVATTCGRFAYTHGRLTVTGGDPDGILRNGFD